ncbi:serpin family protein [Paenibacillus dakarensis]|uniref:serpin family protein n=1 Tax=Paenibacillus dakarensis TaxID=1527293 RepID=UPI0006D58C64|nr:serpin family protein [Paenibacillus dakarensis]
MNKKWIAACLCLVLVTTACGAKELSDEKRMLQETQRQEQEAKERSALLNQLDRRIVESENTFGLLIHKELTKFGNGENVLISPYSLSTGLALAYNGSVGKTAEQMEDVLGWSDLGLNEMNRANRLLRSILELGGGVELNIANSVWVQNDFVMKETYLKMVKDAYEAEIQAADLSHQSSVDSMNKWVNEKTSGMIPEIFSKPPDAKAVLINAVYFNGGWTDEFNPEDTKDKDFSLADGTVKKIPMMKQEQEFGYKETDSWQAVRLPYSDGRMHMVVVVPSKDSSLEELHKELWKDPSDWQKNFESRTVKLELPKFKAELSNELSAKLMDVLKGAGMTDAFDSGTADFSAMAETPLYIGDIRHKVVVDVNEKGTEAAAFTSIGMVSSASEPREPVEMKVDRPFFFAIEDGDTGAWLFMGSITNP